MNRKSEILLRRIYSVDTEAGDRFRYHIMRAEACPEYVDDIEFKESDNLARSFRWAFTPEGYEYWEEIFDLYLRLRRMLYPW